LFGNTQLVWLSSRFLVHLGVYTSLTQLMTHPSMTTSWRRIAAQRITRALVAGLIPVGVFTALYRFPEYLKTPVTSWPQPTDYWMQAMLGYLVGDLLELWFSTWFCNVPAQVDLILHHMVTIGVFSYGLSARTAGGILFPAMSAELMVWFSGALFLSRALQKNNNISDKLAELFMRGLEVMRLLTILFLRLPLWIYNGFCLVDGYSLVDTTTWFVAFGGLMFIIPMDLYWCYFMFKNVFTSKVEIHGEQDCVQQTPHQPAKIKSS